jgi:phospholipid transport system substrate-binding protein
MTDKQALSTRSPLRALAAAGMLALAGACLLPTGALAADAAAAAASAAPATNIANAATGDEFIKKLSSDVLAAIKADTSIKAGDTRQIMALVDTKVLPYVDFERMTQSAMARFWRDATPDQRQRVQAEFKTLLVRTYAGALSQAGDKTLDIKPSRAQPGDKEVIVRSEVRGGPGDPIRLDYRLEKTASGWKIFDVNILGAWLVENYRNTFAQEIKASGIDGLIAKLAERNKAIASKGVPAPAK